MPEYMSDEMSENMSDRMPDRLPDRMPGGMSGYMPDRMPEYMPEYMSDRMSEYTKYMSKYTSWHVMVGITRSRVICFNLFNILQYISFMLREVAALRPSKWDQTPTARVLLLYPSANILGGHWNQWRMRTIGLLDVEPICWTNQLKIVWTN